MIRRDLQWILDGRLAGAAQPGLFAPFADDMEDLQKLGIRLIVTLTERSLEPSPADFGFRCLHFPIPDMGFPAVRPTEDVCRQVTRSIADGEAVLLHCKAGLGRTGLMLASCLVLLGRDATQAIDQIRQVNPLYIQTESQEIFVRHFADFLAGDPKDAGGSDASPAERHGLPALKLKLPS